MALKDNFTTVRLYTEFDPYFYLVDNRPLTDIVTNLTQVANEVDNRAIVVDVSGSATPVNNRLPTGWTVTRNSAGDYTITHTLSQASGLTYSITGTAINATPGILYVYAQTATTFSIKTVNTGGTAGDMRFVCSVFAPTVI